MPDLTYSISYTSRRPRPGEKNGVDYHFITAKAFETGIRQQRWAEWAVVHGNYYGTAAADLEGHLANAKDVLLDIDVQGTIQILRIYPRSITIFIAPPSIGALKSRLEKRGTDSPATIARRLENAQKELDHKSRYQHIITNDQMTAAADELEALIGRIRLQRESI
jgi:guanylate kinase